MSATHKDRFYHRNCAGALPRLGAELDLLEAGLHRRQPARSPGSARSRLATPTRYCSRSARPSIASDCPKRRRSSPATKPAATASGSIVTLVTSGVENLVVDAASIEVNRRKRRAKSDSLDATKLVGMLIRWHLGERKLWGVVHVPAADDEDRRQLHRELIELKAQRTRAHQPDQGRCWPGWA